MQREAAMAAFRQELAARIRRSVTIRLDDQARGCQNDPRDECGSAAIQQDFINDVGHDSLQLRYTLTKR
jgi:hypothetical protein